MKNYKTAEMFLLNNTAQRNQSRVGLFIVSQGVTTYRRERGRSKEENEKH